MAREPEDGEEDDEGCQTDGPADVAPALLRDAQNPARYTGFLDVDNGPAAGVPEGPAPADTPRVDHPRDLGAVAARLAAALTDTDNDSDEGNSDEGNSDEGNSDEGNSDEGNSDDADNGTDGDAAHGSEPRAPTGPEPPADVPHHRLRHPVLRAPLTARHTAVGGPDPGRAAHYRAHSADLTVAGGLETALATGAAVCALAEQYALRRVGGSSAGAVTAAAAAAAELGRTAPAPTDARTPDARTPDARPPDAGTPDARTPDARTPDAVRPGFAGLAAMLTWLRGEEPGHPGRLTRMFAPAPDTRTLHRLVMAVVGPLPPRSAGRPRRVAAATLASLDRSSRAVVVLLWLGALAGGGGVVTALARSPHVAGALAAVAAVPIAVTFALAAAFGTLLLAGHAVWADVRAALDGDDFGLVPGVRPPDADPDADPAGGPAVFEWITDRLDDLSGVPAPSGGADRYALTFGELWLGRMGGRASGDLRLLRRASTDPRRRVVDLVLVATDVSAGRPRLLPFGIGERPEQLTGVPFLFCRSCLVALLPSRVVDQMILMAPGAPAAAGCPRHAGEPVHHLPEPWDLPVAFAVRLAAATPGVLRPVPLYAPSADGTRTHWFADGTVTGGLPARAFDAPLPWWPTFTIDAVDDPDVDDVLVPALDTMPPEGRWRPVPGPAGFATALVAAAATWRDAVRAQVPGRRAGRATVRAAAVPGPFLDGVEIGRLAVRGHRAGQLLRERFTAPDDGRGFTGTDRFRWIRLRSALTEYRQLSLSIGTSLPLYTDLALAYRVPDGLGGWFSPPLAPGQADPAWGDVVAAVTHLRSLADEGVLDWDTDWGAPPSDPHERLA